MPPFFFQNLRLPLLSLLWILFQIDCLVSTSFSCCSGILSCFFIWHIFLCCLLLSDYLYLSSSFLRLQDCNSSRFWCLFHSVRLVLCRLPGGRGWCLHYSGWTLLLSLGCQGNVKRCSLGVSVNLEHLKAICMLINVFLFLSYWLFVLRLSSNGACR